MNNLVKVRIDGKWKIGSLCGNRSGINEKTKVILQSDLFNGKVTEVEGHDVKTYTTLPPLDDYFCVEMAGMAKDTQDVLDDLFPTKNLKVLQANSQIYCNYDTGLTISPSVKVVETIGSFIEKRSWNVNHLSHKFGSIDEPDFVDEIEIGNWINRFDAISAFVQELAKSMCYRSLGKIRS